MAVNILVYPFSFTYSRRNTKRGERGGGGREGEGGGGWGRVRDKNKDIK
jgi:hypothetical protein